MNILSFINKTDNIIDKMSKDELQAFVHEYARTLPEEFRQGFWDNLVSFVRGGDEGITDKSGESGENLCFMQKHENIINRVRMVAAGNIPLVYGFNPDFDRRYDHHKDEFILSDLNGVADIVTEACKYVDDCVKFGEYKLGWQVAEMLLELRVKVEAKDLGEPGYETLDIWDMAHCGLLDFDCKRLAANGIYCAYFSNDLDDRPKELYRMFEKAVSHGITLETVMQTGREIDDIDTFLPIWIEFLGKRSGKCAKNLMDEALDSIDAVYSIRSNIAGKLCLIALDKKLYERMESYWLEMLLSDTNMTNFLRLYAGSRDRDMYIDKIKEIYGEMLYTAGQSGFSMRSCGELRKNRPDVSSIYMMAFFCGDFTMVKGNAVSVAENAQGIPVF